MTRFFKVISHNSGVVKRVVAALATKDHSGGAVSLSGLAFDRRFCLIPLVREQELRERSQRDNTAFGSFSRAKYPVFTKPVLTALHERLITHRTRKEHPDASLYEIGVITGMADRTTGERGDADHRNRVTASVSRYLRDAKALIHNVGEGRFPDTSPPPKP